MPAPRPAPVPSTGARSETEPRAHTGRRRNEATRHAVLTAAVRLLRDADHGPLTLPVIAAAAGVGKQTVYRWWSTPGEVLLEALAEQASAQVPTPDTGSLDGDLRVFLQSSLRGAADPATAPVLRGLVREAARDEQAAGLMRTFTATRRAALRRLLLRHADRFAPDVDVDLLVDQAYGLLWYRLLIGHAPLDDDTARRLAEGLVAAAVGGVAPPG
ncbi:MAG TPA: TetR/AcrR family transcriptional regulator C-terminal ligand-binding domain-containing protein [Pseudonocardia sp.]|nr:TetR/AcrR family transcriptional regulator C-terminal ligand-binding domain-containing protein [Pseudonocardia sp.]